jgi:uncharacterized protein
MDVDRNGLQILTRAECLRLLETATIGRVLTSHRALPVALPVTYALQEDSVVFRTGPGTKLHGVDRGAVLGFEVDDVDPVRRTGWSVLAHGEAYQVTDPDELARLDRLPLEPLAPGFFPFLIRLPLQEVSGRRIVAGQREVTLGA